MASVQKQQAIHLLEQAVRDAHPDDLVEIYNELFPQTPIREDEARANPSNCRQTITSHITQGLEVEEILDLWNVVFPQHRRVSFDEVDSVIHFDESTQHVTAE